MLVSSGPQFKTEAANTILKSLWQLVEKGIRIALGFFVGVWVAKHLGPQEFGKLSFAISILSICAAVTAMGLNGVVVRNLIFEPSSAMKLLTSSSVVVMCAVIVVGFVALSTAVVFGGGHEATWVVLVSLSAILFKPFEVFKYWFESRLELKYIAFADLVALVLVSIFKVGLIQYSVSVEWFALSLGLEALLVSFGLLYFYKTKGNSFHWDYSQQLCLSLVRASWPLIISSVLVALLMNIDKVVLMSILGSDQLGIYAVAYMIFSSLYFIPAVVGGAFVPGLSKTYKDDKAQYLIKIRWLYILFAVSSSIFAATISLLGEGLILLLFGNEFAHSGSLLEVLVWGLVGVSLVSLRGRLLIIENQQKLVPILVGLGFAVYVVLLFILVPKFGSKGAAVAVSVSWAVNGLLLPFLFKSIRHHGFTFSRVAYR